MIGAFICVCAIEFVSSVVGTLEKQRVAHRWAQYIARNSKKNSKKDRNCIERKHISRIFNFRWKTLIKTLLYQCFSLIVYLYIYSVINSHLQKRCLRAHTFVYVYVYMYNYKIDTPRYKQMQAFLFIRFGFDCHTTKATLEQQQKQNKFTILW